MSRLYRPQPSARPSAQQICLASVSLAYFIRRPAFRRYGYGLPPRTTTLPRSLRPPNQPPTALSACFESNLLIVSCSRLRISLLMTDAVCLGQLQGPNPTAKAHSTIVRPCRTRCSPSAFASNYARRQLDDCGLIDNQAAPRYCRTGSTDEVNHPMAVSTSGWPKE
ncbi:hypothetical protein BDP81DRAFT_192479 [Colletotrichum phormii]|uniref:Uncharacterized protein n=1 Tax=Colletotrichum phormii TaxID=359342 RepID=A0AAJ0EH48_9PEZI|nr:uncharacterized protein BDP81DRAFT_192479 [Colletotrichum phormii]KAK1638843.1 hypothetical protein BDP81DRAFT_192479 [Colletotrichum phormii]